MSKKLKQELDVLNENLKALVANQEVIYSRLGDIETKLKEQKTDIDKKT